MKVQVILSILILFCTAPLYAGPVDNFSFTDITGKTYDRGNVKSKPVVINIGSHWWKNCRDEAPELQRAYSTYKDQGVVFLGVFVMSKEKDIRKFAKKYQLSFPVGRDNGIAEELGTRAIPTTFFINREGRTVKRHTGPIRFNALKAGIEEIIKE